MILDSGGFPPAIYDVQDLRYYTGELVKENLDIMRQVGLIDLRAYPYIKYRPEPFGVNYFQNVLDIIESGEADCEDFGAWLASYYLFQNIPAYPDFERQSSTLYHVITWAKVGSNGRRYIRLDPSKWFGMGR